MELRLGLIGLKRSFELSRFAKYRNAGVVLLAALLVIPLTLLLLKPGAIVDLAHSADGRQALATGWAKGDMIVLVRHVERCDHSKAVCLDGADGITERAQDVAVGLGRQFQALGLNKADIYSSPVTRAAQTSIFMFGRASSGQDWLFNCRGTLLRDALQHKVAGRNLILVTHSECMASLEHSLKLPNPTLGYGASLFITAGAPSVSPRVLGFVEASDWRRVLPL